MTGIGRGGGRVQAPGAGPGRWCQRILKWIRVAEPRIQHVPSLPPVPTRRRGAVRGALQLALGAWLIAIFAGCATVPPMRVSLDEIPPGQVLEAQRNLRVFNAVWDLVNRKHYHPETRGPKWDAAAEIYGPQAALAPDDRALYRVINAMLEPLDDSHTFALTPTQALERRTQVRTRTGFNMQRVDDRWIVTDVLPGSPAEIAGVKAGWIVVARNGEPLGDRIDFRPRTGEDASWDFLDENDQLVRVSPPAKQLSTAARQIVRELEDGFIYLRFDEFNRHNRRWLGQQLRAHAKAPGLVIDLRRNPGGETFSLGIIIGEFFDRAVDAGTFISRNGARSAKNSWQLGSANYAGKVVVLVGSASGSAAEIFAAVLQDHERATVVGRQTAGAVLASWFYRLPEGGELQLSREDYIAPKGRRIEGVGIEPDVVVSRTLNDLRAGRDRDLEVALEILRRE
jgi:carboxyl-terminal processing protease